MPRKSKAIAAIAILAAAFTLAAAAGASTDPKGLVLTLQDMPTGFHTQASSGYTSLEAAAKQGKLPAAQYRAWGYVTAYEADFSRTTSLGDFYRGASEIESATSVYRTAAGAEQSLEMSAKKCATAPAHELSAGVRIGDEVHLCSFAQKGAQVYLVIWRHGNLKSAVTIAGLKGFVSPTQAVRLAARQDKLMR